MQKYVRLNTGPAEAEARQEDSEGAERAYPFMHGGAHTCVSSTCAKPQLRHAGAWNAQPMLRKASLGVPFSILFLTGGSWKKSPHTTSWRPPAGLSLSRT